MTPSEGGFPWGLTPGGGGEPEESKSDPPAGPSTEEPTQAMAVQPAAEEPTQAMAVQPAAEEPTQAMAVQPPAEEPTQAMAVQPPTEAYPAALDPALDGPGEALAPHHIGHVDPVDEGLEASSIDSLFGDAAFIEYGEHQPAPGGGDLVRVPAAPRPRSAQITQTQKVLMWVAGGLFAALALVALFLLGTRIAPAPAVVASPSPSPSAIAVPAVGPLAPGEYSWSELVGGECLEPFESAWQDNYVVVDCGQPHAAQLVARGVLDDAAGTPYPGVEALPARIVPLCTVPTVIDFAAAGGMADIEVLTSFPADAPSWDSGERDFFCFVHRSGGEPLATSVAVPPAP